LKTTTELFVHSWSLQIRGDAQVFLADLERPGIEDYGGRAAEDGGGNFGEMMRATRWLLIFLALACLASAEDQPLRFLVMGDPQFKLAKPGQPEAGYVWTSDVWAKLPNLMRRVHAKYLFVCGDIFEYKVGDGTTITGLWDEWDKYVATFKAAGRVEWITGGHEFWGGKTESEPRDVFLKRYPDHVRYRIVDGENVFILFDDLHDPNYLDPNGLAWLEKTLGESAAAKHVWFFGHVPPRNTADWWPTGERPRKDAFRIRLAELLEKRGITAAFFGHEHMET